MQAVRPPLYSRITVLNSPTRQRWNSIVTYQKLEGRPTFDTFSFFYDQEILDLLDVAFVEFNDIVLRPALAAP